MILADLQDSVAGYIGGIARQNGMIAMAVGGTQDHVHLFLAIPPTMPVSKAVQLVKAGSSKWFRETHSRLFAWQEEYGALSVSKSNEKKVVSYIRGQRGTTRSRISWKSSRSRCENTDCNSNPVIWIKVPVAPAGLCHETNPYPALCAGLNPPCGLGSHYPS